MQVGVLMGPGLISVTNQELSLLLCSHVDKSLNPPWSGETFKSLYQKSLMAQNSTGLSWQKWKHCLCFVIFWDIAWQEIWWQMRGNDTDISGVLYL